MRPILPDYDALQPLLEQIDQSHIFSNFGPISMELRLEYSKYLGVSADRIVPLANATLAIQGCLEFFEQKDWILPDYTFAATGHAALAAKKEITLADVRPDNFQLEIPKDLDRSLFGAIPVMPFGAPVIFEDWAGFKALVIDAAASLGSTPPDFDLMPASSFVVYSLHATKVLGAGEGALVICHTKEDAQALMSWSNFGFDSTRLSAKAGTNAKMSEISCAVALASIRNIEMESREWCHALDLVEKERSSNLKKTIVDYYSGFRPYWIIETKNYSEKRALVEHLKSVGVESRSWWPAPLSQMPAFGHIATLKSSNNSLYFAERHLGLPIWKGISEKELKYINDAITTFYTS